jgi:hypothetical protein
VLARTQKGGQVGASVVQPATKEQLHKILQTITEQFPPNAENWSKQRLNLENKKLRQLLEVQRNAAENQCSRLLKKRRESWDCEQNLGAMRDATRERLQACRNKHGEGIYN